MKSYGQFCSIARALDLLGERWTLLVVRELLCGSRRFGEIQRGIPRISRTMLSARLRELTDAGAIESRDGAAGPEYELTAAGHELADALRLLAEWGGRHSPGAEAPRHAVCGAPLETRWYCPSCERTVGDDEEGELHRV